MDALEAIRKRKSYRGAFKPDPIPREDLITLAEAGFLAPSGCNMQTTKFIVIDDPALAKKLGVISRSKWAEGAPAGIALVTKRQTIAPSGEDYHVQDFAAAAENILIAITAMGYGTTWLEGQLHTHGDDKLMADLLGLPEDYYVAVYLPIGIPDATVPDAAKIPFRDRVWFNRFGKTEC